MRKGIGTLVRELRDHGRNCGLHHMGGAPIPLKYHFQMSKHIKEGFDRWWDSWMKPTLDEIDQKVKKKGKQ